MGHFITQFFFLYSTTKSKLLDLGSDIIIKIAFISKYTTTILVEEHGNVLYSWLKVEF
jgi:hypothetical protein